MSEQMTPYEAIETLAAISKSIMLPVKMTEASKIGAAALRSSIPHVLTLTEASSLEPHTAVWVEFRLHGTMDGPYAVGSILRKGDWSCYLHTVRWWNLWPSEELRAATPWEEKQNA